MCMRQAPTTEPCGNALEYVIDTLQGCVLVWTGRNSHDTHPHLLHDWVSSVRTQIRG